MKGACFVPTWSGSVRFRNSACRTNIKSSHLNRTLIDVFWYRPLIDVFWYRTLIDVFWYRTLIDVFWYRCLIDVFWYRPLIDVFWYRPLIDVFWYRTLIDVFWYRPLIDVFWYRTLIDVFWYRTLIDVFWYRTLIDEFWSALPWLFGSVKCYARDSIFPRHLEKKNQFQNNSFTWNVTACSVFFLTFVGDSRCPRERTKYTQSEWTRKFWTARLIKLTDI